MKPHRLLGLTVGVVLTGWPSLGESTQIAPNPNPAGSTIAIVNDPTAFNAESFDNLGAITVDATSTLTNYLTNPAPGIRNNGTLSTIQNNGTLVNNGGILNDGGRVTTRGTFINNNSLTNGLDNFSPSRSYLTNSGTFTNNRDVDNFGLMTNSGTLTNAGRMVTFNGDIETSGLLSNSGRISVSFGGLNNSGTVLNSGVIGTGDTGFFGNSGTVINNGTVGGNHTSNGREGQWTNNGTVQVNGGEFFNFGTMTNTATVLFDIPGFAHSTVFGNAGTLTNHAGSTWTMVGDPDRNFTADMFNEGAILNEAGSVLTLENAGSRLTNNGTITHAGTLTSNGLVQNGGNFFGQGGLPGTFTNTGSILGTGTYTQIAGATINNGILTQYSVEIQGGSLSGLGTINAPLTLTSGASLSPGTESAFGTLTLNGDLTSTGNLFFGLGGTEAGKFDVLRINGNALFTDGNLQFDFADGFTEAAGNSWNFLYASSLSGWDNLNISLHGLEAGLGYRITSSNGVQTLTLVAQNVPEPGSFLLLGAGLASLIGLRRILCT